MAQSASAGTGSARSVLDRPRPLSLKFRGVRGYGTPAWHSEDGFFDGTLFSSPLLTERMAGQDSLALAALPPSGGEAKVCPPGSLPPFSEVYQRYFDFVWSSVRHLGVGNGAIDDVVQEVFIVVYEKLHTVQRPESLRSWVYGVVRRTVSGHRRSRAATESPSGSPNELERSLGPAPFTPLDSVEQNAKVQLLQALLAELDEPKREVFILAELEEMPVPEIAEALEIPVNTAYSRLRAARQGFEAGLARRAARLKEKGLR